MDFRLDQILIDYPKVGDCIGDVDGPPIPWALKNLMLCGRDVLNSSIDPLREIIALEEDDKDMEEFQNSQPILPTSPKTNGLPPGMWKLLESKEASCPS